MKRSFDDIVPPERRSIRKVANPRHPRGVADRDTRASSPVPEAQAHDRRPFRTGLWIVVIVSLAILGFALSFLFSGAKVIVTPKQRSVLVDSRFDAVRAPAVNELGYEIMTIEKEGSAEIVARGESFVEERASGRIVVYNDYSASPQTLIRNTRFETPEGLIYRINESTVVPGQTKDGNVTIPGSIEVTVYADEPGDRYNVGLTDFTIPGFLGDPRHSKFYARSKTNMAGGFSGNRKVASDEDRAAAREQIENNLRSQLLNEAFSQKPQGFELYEDAIFIEFTELPQEDTDLKVGIREKATLYGVLFDQAALATFIARHTVAGFEDEDVFLADSAQLTFAIVDKETAQPWLNERFSFDLRGAARIVWVYDKDRLTADLAGKEKGAFETVLSGYPSIDEAQIVLRPFWRQSFPEDPGDIKISSLILE